MTLKKHSQIVFASSTISDGNMSTIKGDPLIAIKNRELFLRKFGLKLSQVVNMFLEHKDNVVVVNKNDLGKGAFDLEDGISSDAIVTNEKDLILMVMTGDCLPISFYDSQKQIIALIHGSKKNLASKILDNTVKVFKERFQSKSANLIVSIGPSIGPCCYYLDLWSIAEKKLKRLGIPQKNIYNYRVCTYHTNKYFSHRRASDKNQGDLRFATILGIKNAS